MKNISKPNALSKVSLTEREESEGENPLDNIRAIIGSNTLDAIQKAAEIKKSTEIFGRFYEGSYAVLMLSAMEVEKEKLWRWMDLKSFAEYLDCGRFLPFKRDKYYKLEKVFPKETPAVFDLFTGHKIPTDTRLLLAENNVKIDVEGNEIVINGNRSPLDKASVAALVTAVAESFVLRDHRENVDKKVSQKAIDKLQKNIDARDRTIANLQNTNFNELTGTPHMRKRIELGLAYNRMREAVLALSDIEKDQFRDSVLEDIARWNEDLRACYKTNTSGQQPAIPTTLVGDTIDEKIANFLNEKINIDAAVDENDAKLTNML